MDTAYPPKEPTMKTVYEIIGNYIVVVGTKPESAKEAILAIYPDATNICLSKSGAVGKTKTGIVSANFIGYKEIDITINEKAFVEEENQQ